jgi:hypothetical protein
VRVLKGIGLAILGFLLFVALSVFGLALTLNSTVLNPRFLPDELDKLDVAALVTETIGPGGADLSPAMSAAVVRTVVALQPQIKGQLRAASTWVYAYVLGDTQSIHLAAVLKETVLNPEFVTSVANQADVVALARQDLRDQLADLIPVGQRQLVRYLDTAMPSLDPWLAQQINAASGPVVDYLLGASPTLRVVIPLEPMKTILRPNLRLAFLSSPPPELAGATPSQMEIVFNQYYELAAAQIPTNATIDPASLGLSQSASLAQALSDAESALGDARSGIGCFRFYYALLMVLVGLLIFGIVLIHHEVKGASRNLGIILLICGIFEFIGALIGGYFLRAVGISGLPAALQSWLPGVYVDFFRPLQVFSLALMIVGLVLVIASLLSRRRATV